MRNIITCIAALASLQCFMYSQNAVEPNSILSYIHHADNSAFQFHDYTQSFIRGWNWGGPNSLIDSAMHMNMYHDAPTMTIYRFWTNTWTCDFARDRYIIPALVHDSRDNITPLWTTLTELQTGYGTAEDEKSNGILNCQALVLEAANTVNPDALNPEVTQGTIFGFRTHGVGQLGSGSSLGMWVLTPQMLPPSNNPTVALAGAWQTDFLRFENSARISSDPLTQDQYFKSGCSGKRNAQPTRFQEDSDGDRLYHREFNGKRLQISINIQVNQFGIIPGLLDEPVLIIRVPTRRRTYSLDASNNIVVTQVWDDARFSQLPDASQTPISLISSFTPPPPAAPANLGLWLPMTGAQPEPTLFIVTPRMLQGAANSQITLSAQIECDGSLLHPRLLPRDFLTWNGEENNSEYSVGIQHDTPLIDSFDVEVTYAGIMGAP